MKERCAPYQMWYYKQRAGFYQSNARYRPNEHYLFKEKAYSIYWAKKSDGDTQVYPEKLRRLMGDHQPVSAYLWLPFVISGYQNYETLKFIFSKSDRGENQRLLDNLTGKDKDKDKGDDDNNKTKSKGTTTHDGKPLDIYLQIQHKYFEYRKPFEKNITLNYDNKVDRRQFIAGLCLVFFIAMLMVSCPPIYTCLGLFIICVADYFELFKNEIKRCMDMISSVVQFPFICLLNIGYVLTQCVITLLRLLYHTATNIIGVILPAGVFIASFLALTVIVYPPLWSSVLGAKVLAALNHNVLLQVNILFHALFLMTVMVGTVRASTAKMDYQSCSPLAAWSCFGQFMLPLVLELGLGYGLYQVMLLPEIAGLFSLPAMGALHIPTLYMLLPAAGMFGVGAALMHLSLFVMPFNRLQEDKAFSKDSISVVNPQPIGSSQWAMTLPGKEVAFQQHKETTKRSRMSQIASSVRKRCSKVGK